MKDDNSEGSESGYTENGGFLDLPLITTMLLDLSPLNLRIFY